MEQARIVFPAAPLLKELYLCTGGKSRCGPGHSFGPDVRLNYLIHYVLSGKGVFKTDEASYTLEAGQGFLICPGRSTWYQADHEDPWTYLWVGFNGTLAGAILEEIGLSYEEPVFSCRAGDELDSLMESLLLPPPENQNPSLNQQSLLLLFLHLLSRSSSVPQRPGERQSNYYISRALAYIQANYGNYITVADVAHYLGISRCYLFDLFKSTMNHSPQEYLSSFRLGRARELLTTTAYPVQDIALLCGYRDPDVFTKAFKRKYLASPTQYRRYTLEHPECSPMDYIRSLRRGNSQQQMEV